VISPEPEKQEDDTTKTSAVRQIVPIPQTLTSMVRQVEGLRDRVQATSDQVTELHRQINASDLDRRTAFKVREGVVPLLEQLAIRRGMSWSVIALTLGVSVQAVRKWRMGTPATGENRLALARLTAFIDILDELNIDDPVSWLEVPLVSGYSLRGLDLYAAGKIELLLEWAGMRISAEQLLDAFAPDWRTRNRLSYETFEAPDGNLSIRRRR
jgi:hypothetical protein